MSSDDSVEDDRDVGEGALLDVDIEDVDMREIGEDGMLVSVTGGNLDTEEYTEPVGLMKDVSKEASTGSANGTEIMDGDGCNIDESYESSVSVAHSDSCIDGVEIDEPDRRIVTDDSVTLEGVGVRSLVEGNDEGTDSIRLSPVDHVGDNS